jgi:hypothetical protein
MKEPAIANFIKNHQLDLYIKKMNTAQLMILLIYGIISQAKGLLDISGSLKNDTFSTQLRLESISSSQLSRRISKLPLDLAWALFNLIKIEALKNVKGTARTLHIIDSTTITMCLSRYQWATFRNDKGGVKLHLRIVYKDKHAYPDHATFTNALAADKTQMNELIVDETGAINVYDRGYVDYKKLNEFCHTGVLFTTRLKGNAVFQVCDERAVDPNGSVIRDCNIILGQGVTRVQGILRMIEALDLQGVPVVIISNAHHFSAQEIADIYRYRWQIELFFKWIKQHLQVKHFYSLSREAVHFQLVLALACYLMFELIKNKAGYQGSLLNVARLVITCLLEPWRDFISKLCRPASRSSQGRRRPRHEEIFEYTVRQVMAGEADYLDDLAFDPLID